MLDGGIIINTLKVAKSQTKIRGPKAEHEEIQSAYNIYSIYILSVNCSF